MSKVHELNKLHPLDCPFVNQVRRTWANYDWYYDKGYIRYYDGGAALLREHQLVAAIAHGLPDGFHVHHIDEMKLNNRARNLAVLTGSAHTQLHHPQQPIVLLCPVCQHAYETKWSLFLRRDAHYCGVECMRLARRKVERPSAQYLSTLLREIGNWTTLGRMFGVSDNAVRKWAKQYDLDLSICDGRLHR